MSTHRPILIIALWFAAHAAPSFASPVESSGARVHEHLARLLAGFDARTVTTGILYDRTVSLSGHERYDGSAEAPAANLRVWRQMLHEINHASLDPGAWPLPASVVEGAEPALRKGVTPLGLLNVRYQSLRPSSLEDGTLTLRDGQLTKTATEVPLVESRLVAAAALKALRAHGSSQRFVLARESYLTNDDRDIQRLEIDLDDGRGFREVGFDQTIPVRYARDGSKTIQVRLTLEDGETLWAKLAFEVTALQAPSPDDTLSVTGTIPFAGGVASGDAYVYLAEGHTEITNPVVALEGFDIENNLDWEEIYEILNQENLVETLRSVGYDTVVLNFTDSTDYIQRNALLAVELIQQIEARIDPAATFPVIGASLGGLAARYALAYMQSEGISHRVRNFISFDAPHAGANIPLGVQYWLDFFGDLSADASFLLSRLDTPASRQLLLYHHTTPPGTTGESDPLRADFLSDLAAVGDYPTNVRMVAVSNGSSMQMDQGFAAGDPIIQYEYDSLLVDLTGNVWAVPDGASQTIFDGRIWIFLVQNESMSVTVDATWPYDNAPGGFRGSMAQMDSTEAPYGDIIALHDNHAFIPTISALALDHTSDPFYDIAGDPDLMSHTPFDDVFVATVNEEHVTISPAMVPWLLTEITRSPTAASPVPVAWGPVLYQNAPNPFNPTTSIRFGLSASTPVTLEVFDTRGRRVDRLLDSHVYGPGVHEVTWTVGRGVGPRSGTDARGSVASGVYFYRLTTPETVQVKKMVVVE